MVDVTSSAWFPVMTLVTGYIMKEVSDRLEHSRTLQRERENRKEMRRIQVAERRADFHRQTLLDLQEVLQDFARAAGAAYHADVMAFKKTGTWAKELVPTEIDNNILIANRRCLMLGVRVRDESVRNLVESFRTHTNGVSLKSNNKETQEELTMSAQILETLQKRIGELLRKLDDEE